MFELVLEFFSSGRVLDNNKLRELSRLKINSKTGEVIKGNRRPIFFIIGDVSLYQGYEYNPDDMSINKLEQSMAELKQAVKKSIHSIDIDKNDRDVEVGMVSPAPTPSMGR